MLGEAVLLVSSRIILIGVTFGRMVPVCMFAPQLNFIEAEKN